MQAIVFAGLEGNMKGKLAFVVGAAVGYVLGSRAGRQRYEQIKRGAQKIWNTEPVQHGVGVVREAVDERADDLKQVARRVGSQLLGKLSEQAAGKPRSGDARGGAKKSEEDAAPSAAAGGPADSSADGAAAREAAANPAADEGNA